MESRIHVDSLAFSSVVADYRPNSKSLFSTLATRKIEAIYKLGSLTAVVQIQFAVRRTLSVLESHIWAMLELFPMLLLSFLLINALRQVSKQRMASRRTIAASMVAARQPLYQTETAPPIPTFLGTLPISL